MHMTTYRDAGKPIARYDSNQRGAIVETNAHTTLGSEVMHVGHFTFDNDITNRDFGR